MKYGRVLLADSHLSILQGVHSLLDALFETVLMVADERSLIKVVEIFEPDLVVVDLSLPGEAEANETNVARRLMERHPAQRLIVLSFHDEPTVAALVRNTGAAGFVLKRHTAAHLPAAVHEVLRGGTYASPSQRTSTDEDADDKEPAHA